MIVCAHARERGHAAAVVVAVVATGDANGGAEKITYDCDDCETVCCARKDAALRPYD